VALVCAGRDEQEAKDSECGSCVSRLYIRGYCMTRAVARHVGAPWRLIIWGHVQNNNLAPLNRYFSKFFSLGQGWRVYRVIQEESAILLEMIVCVILSKKVHMNMCPILDGCGVMGIY